MTRVRLIQAVDALAWLALASLVHVVLFGGFTLRLGGFKLSAHDAVPLAVQVAVLFALRRVVAGSFAGGLADRANRVAHGFATFAAANRRACPAVVGIAVAVLVGLALLAPRAGLTARYFDNPEWAGQPFLVARDREPTLSRTSPPWFHENFSIEWSGVMYVERRGEYQFVLESDDGATLEIDEAMVVDNSGPHSVVRSDGSRAMDAGFHPIRVRFAQTVGGFALRAAWNPIAVEGETPGERPFAEAVLFERTPQGTAAIALRTMNAVAAIGRAVAALLLAGGVFLLMRISLASSQRKLDGGQGLQPLATFPEPEAPGLHPEDRATRRTGARWRDVPRFAAGGVRAFTRWFVTRRRAITGMGIAVVAALAEVVVSDAFDRGLTARYYAAAEPAGEPMLVARDPFPRRDRLIYDFTHPDGTTSVAWTGVIHLPAPGDYRFAVRSRTPARVSIDGRPVVEGASESQPKIGTLRATPGFHLIRVDYADDRNVGGPFEVLWSYEERRLEPLSTAALFRASPDRSWIARTRFEVSERVRRWLPRLALALAFALGGVAIWWLRAVSSRRRFVPSPEAAAHIVLFVVVACVYAWASVTHSESFWAFAKIGWYAPFRDPVVLAALWCAMAFVLVAVRRHPLPLRVIEGEGDRGLVVRRLSALALAATAAVVFFSLRNGFVNIDGTSYRWMIPEVVRGTFEPSVDEMWERQLHAWFWQGTHAVWGWSVRTSYQAASAIAGGGFLLVLWSLARRLAPRAPALFALLVLGGGYVQLFFGEVEHYSFVAVAILIYLWLAIRHLRGEIGVVAPAAGLALAMSCHMLAGFLLPSLGVLYVRAIWRRAIGQVVLASAAAALVLVVTIVAVGLPLSAVYQGSAGTQAIRRLVGAALSSDAFGEGAVSLSNNWAFFRFDAYHWDQYNLLALMFPGHLAGLLLVAWKRVRLDAVNVFLVVAALGMAFFQFNYRALLPLAHDWNLFANAALPATVLVWRALVDADGLPGRLAIAAGWAALSWTSTLAWVLANHGFQP